MADNAESDGDNSGDELVIGEALLALNAAALLADAWPDAIDPKVSQSLREDATRLFSACCGQSFWIAAPPPAAASGRARSHCRSVLPLIHFIPD